MKADVAAWSAVSDNALTAFGRESLGGGIGNAGVSTFVTSTISVSFAFLSFEGFQRVSQLPDDLRSTVTEVVAVTSISPTNEVSGLISRCTTPRMLRTSHVLHRDFKLLPAPTILATIDLSHDILQFQKASFRLWAQIMLGDFVPVLLWYLAFDTARLDFLEPLVDRHVFLGLSIKHGRVSPGLVDGVEVEFLDLECLEHRE